MQGEVVPEIIQHHPDDAQRAFQVVDDHMGHLFSPLVQFAQLDVSLFQTAIAFFQVGLAGLQLACHFVEWFEKLEMDHAYPQNGDAGTDAHCEQRKGECEQRPAQANDFGNDHDSCAHNDQRVGHLTMMCQQ